MNYSCVPTKHPSLCVDQYLLSENNNPAFTCAMPLWQLDQLIIVYLLESQNRSQGVSVP